MPEVVTPPAEPAPTPETVTVRMYRGLLGDCFLLTHQYGDQKFTALIDCGVLQCIGTALKKPETSKGAAHMKAVVANLLKDISRPGPDGQVAPILDLIVGTHEHYDHLSGFLLQFAAFKDVTVRSVWLAWTENLQDAEARAIWANGRKGLAALQAAVNQSMSLHLAEDRARGDVIADLLQFYGEIDPVPLGQSFAATGEPPTPRVPPRSCYDIIQWLKTKPLEPRAESAGVPTEERVRYLEPGQVVAFGVGKRLTAKVLGPPRTAKRLLQLNPTEGPHREVYLTRSDDVAALASTLRLGAAARGEEAIASVGAEHFPFSERFRSPLGDNPEGAMDKLYYDPKNEERRIDGEWLGSAEALALKIDGDVNNTSLVLAIELPSKNRHVLLFPADAQVGNWLSWHDQLYKVKAGAGSDAASETAEQLLGRVILYKVGHHGSHNATARGLGLELMTSPHLVALMPVVEEVAGEQSSKHNPDGWAMPYPDLYKRLGEKTRKRILRGDGDPAVEAKAFAEAQGLFDLGYESQTADPLWVELTHRF